MGLLVYKIFDWNHHEKLHEKIPAEETRLFNNYMANDNAYKIALL